MGVWWGQGEETRGVPKGTQTASHLLPLISLDYVPGTGLGSQRRSPAPKDLQSSGRHRHRELAISHNARQMDDCMIWEEERNHRSTDRLQRGSLGNVTLKGR